MPTRFSLSELAIKVAIEYCLAIGEIRFLFGEILGFFTEKGLEPYFVDNLCSPIMAGQFKHEYIPEDLILKLVKKMEVRQKYNIIEQIILHINIDLYKGTPDHPLS